MSINDVVDNTGTPENEFQGAENEVITGSAPVVEGGGIFQGVGIKDILLCPTGPDDDYIAHPLNFAKSEGLGKVIRGFTGLLSKFANCNTLRLALLDIVFGFLQFKKELSGGGKVERAAASTTP